MRGADLNHIAHVRLKTVTGLDTAPAVTNYYSDKGCRFRSVTLLFCKI